MEVAPKYIQMITADPIRDRETFIEGRIKISAGGERGPLRESVDIATKSFNERVGHKSKTKAWDDLSQFPLNEGSVQWQMLSQTNNFPQYGKTTQGIQGLYAFQNAWTAHEKMWLAKGFGAAQYGTPTGPFQMINPLWDKNPNFYGSSTMDQAFALTEQQGPTPYATNDLLTLQMWATNEDYQSSIHNPMSATWALAHQTNNLLAMQAQGIVDKQFQGSVQVNSAAQTLQAEQALANAKYQNSISHDAFINGSVMKTDPVAEANAKKSGKKWNPDTGTYEDDPNFNLTTGESKAQALATGLPPNAPPGSSLYNKNGKRATSGHYYAPDGKTLLNWQGQSKRKRKFEHGLATARQDAMYAGYAAAAVGGAALAATGVGAVVAPALLAAYAGGLTAVGAASIGAGVAAAGVQEGATYADPEATYAMKKQATTNLAINAGLALGAGALAAGAGSAIAGAAGAGIDAVAGAGTAAYMSEAAGNAWNSATMATRATLGVDEATYGAARASQIYAARAAAANGYMPLEGQDLDAEQVNGPVRNPMQADFNDELVNENAAAVRQEAIDDEEVTVHLNEPGVPPPEESTMSRIGRSVNNFFKNTRVGVQRGYTGNTSSYRALPTNDFGAEVENPIQITENPEIAEVKTPTMENIYRDPGSNVNGVNPNAVRGPPIEENEGKYYERIINIIKKHWYGYWDNDSVGEFEKRDVGITRLNKDLEDTNYKVSHFTKRMIVLKRPLLDSDGDQYFVFFRGSHRGDLPSALYTFFRPEEETGFIKGATSHFNNWYYNTPTEADEVILSGHSYGGFVANKLGEMHGLQAFAEQPLAPPSVRPNWFTTTIRNRADVFSYPWSDLPDTVEGINETFNPLYAHTNTNIGFFPNNFFA